MTAAEAVANGAQLLDERYPGWYRKIDLENLHIEDACSCICGQLGNYEEDLFHVVDTDRWSVYAERYLGCPRWSVGAREWISFITSHGFSAMPDITDEWRLAIMARRDLDTLPEQIEKKEAVPA